MKAWTALIGSAALTVVGALPVLCLVALFVWQLGTLLLTRSWVPLPVTLLLPEDLPPAALSLLTRVHAGLVPALLGLGIAALGMRGMLRQRAALRAQVQRREDRLRRVHAYRTDEPADRLDGRREPFILSDSPRFLRRNHESGDRRTRAGAGHRAGARARTIPTSRFAS